MASTHSALSPSAAERWVACPGSIALSATVPKKPSSPAAAQGTCTHTLGEWLVTGQVTEADIRKLIGTKMATWDGFIVPVTEEMVDGAVLYAETVEALAQEFGTTTKPVIAKAEAKVAATSIDPEVRGTADYVLYQVGKRLVVIDLKFGKKAVNPVENKQLGIYLVGAMDSLAKTDNFEELELIVVQPRAGGKPVRRWVVPMEWVKNFREEMRKAVAETRKPKPKLAAGNWCFFCPVKGVKREDGSLACPEIGRELQKQAHADFDSVPTASGMPSPATMNAEAIAKTLSWKSVILSWFTDLEERAKEMRQVGLDVPGFKLVESRTHRQWAKDAAAVVEDLALFADEKDLYGERELKSVSQVEELLGGKKTGFLEKMGLVKRAKGELVIVPMDDGREEVEIKVVSTAADDFAGIEGAAEEDPFGGMLR